MGITNGKNNFNQITISLQSVCVTYDLLKLGRVDYLDNKNNKDNSDKVVKSAKTPQTTDDVVSAINTLTMKVGQAVGLLEDISNNANVTASNTRKTFQAMQ